MSVIGITSDWFVEIAGTYREVYWAPKASLTSQVGTDYFEMLIAPGVSKLSYFSFAF